MKPYPKTKPSGVEWLGDVPEHWEVKRLKYSVSINDDSLPETTAPDFEFEYVDIGSVNATDGITTTETILFEGAPSRARRKVQDGDTIVSTVRTYLRAIAPVIDPPGNLIVSTGFAVVRPRKVEPGFLGFALREASFVETVVSRSTGVSYPAVNASDVGRITIALPPPTEQTAIAAYLDRETGRMDALVGKKRELIERLKEKRTALISSTVTRGLPADLPPATLAQLEQIAGQKLPLNPPLKPSGIEWLGDVPEHWEVKRLRRVVNRIEQGWSPECSSAVASIDEWGVVKAGCCNGGHFNPEENKALPPDLKPPRSLEINSGDLLMSRASGSEDLIGSVALVPSGTRKNLLLSDKTYRLLWDEGVIEPGFLARVLQSPIGRSQIQSVISGARGLAKNIAQRDIKDFSVAVPPLLEQLAIAAHLDQETAKLDVLVAKVETAIERLQEYRSALITATVTGKIDVRTPEPTIQP